MSYILSAVKQIRFPWKDSPFGRFQICINRPGHPDLNQAASDTLLLVMETDIINGDYSPFLVGDVSLSKKFTTTIGRRALDDVTIAIRDSYGYTGTIDGAPVAERFDLDFLTFFDVWFDQVSENPITPYRSIILWNDLFAGTTKVGHGGWIDPTYGPISEPFVINPGTSSQIFLGTRATKITSLSPAQLSITWKNVLAPYDITNNPSVPVGYTGIVSADCIAGLPYNGFMLAPPSCSGFSNTRKTAFGGGRGDWYQAVPHFHRNNATADPVLVRVPPASWPLAPWTSNSMSGTVSQLANDYDATFGYAVLGGLSGYAVGDTGTIDYSISDPGSGVLASYVVTHIIAVGGFQIVYIQFTNYGSNYAVDSGTNHTTTVTTGVGSGMLLAITKVSTGAGWGPSGLVFITLGTIFAKIAEAMGMGTFTPSTDLASALGFWVQQVQESAGQACFPISVAGGAVPLEDIYISLNVYAQSHPFDGSLWGNPVGFTPDTAIIDVLTGLCNFLLADFNEPVADDGTSVLALTAMGETSSPTIDFQFQGTPQIEEPVNAPTNVQVTNRADSLAIQCPLSDKGTSSSIEIPIRLHRIGGTSGNNTIPDVESSSWDGTDATLQADSCFKVAWFDGSGKPVVNPDCWKGLCYAYWFNASNVNRIYPADWNAFPNNDGSDGDWSNSFYVINACYKSGSTPSADLQAEIQGNDYFNSRDLHAVAFAALTLLRSTVETFQYAGLADTTGSIQAITSGIHGNWRLRQNGTQDWRGIQIDQTLITGSTTIKYQPINSSGAFPDLTDLIYGPVTGGGTSSSTGGNTQTGGQPNGNNPVGVWSVSTVALSATTNNLAIALTTPNVYVQLSATGTYDLTGIIPTLQCVFLKLRNTGTHIITLKDANAGSSAENRFSITGGDLPFRPNQTLEFIYDTTLKLWICSGAY